MQNDLKRKFNASDVYLNKTNGLEKVRVGVGVALLNEQCQLLLELRSDVSMWGITGGKLDAGETPNSKSVPTGISKLRVTKFAPSTKA